MLRQDVSFVYAAALGLVLFTAAFTGKRKFSSEKLLAHWMVVLAVIGLSAAVILSIEKIELLENPDHITSCSVSPIVACSPVVSSPEASAFGFANSFIGIFGFSAVLAAGYTLIAGATKLKKAWWRTLYGGIVFGTAFSIWLIYQGLFDIGKLCLYCMLVWLVTFALLWLVTKLGIEQKHLNFGSRLNRILIQQKELIAISYGAIFLLIFARWTDYWVGLFS
jgi:uncharacterized membrane protein